MSLSDSSGLSSPPSSDNEEEPPKPAPPPPNKTLKLKGGKLHGASAEASALSSPEPEVPAREPSPPHEYVLADNPDIAFLVMFRSRFSEVFPKNVPNLGPQDIERGVVETAPSEQIENLLCALLGLVLNRKKYVERGHHGRALEEAISTHKNQWPRSWQGSNPLPGTKTFADLNPTERLSLLKTLVLWALNASDAVTGIIKESYKQSRQNDDLNQPLSIQPWGADDRKRRYWLIEGQNDTPFRLYRESAPRIVNKTWWSVAGTIDELKAVGEDLSHGVSQGAQRLSDRITLSIPRLEETQEKRKRKEYRQARRAAFLRPEPGYSLYEGRTRGKKMKYTFSDDEDFSESSSVRRSTRHSNGNSTSAELNGPTVTASGRQVRSRFGRSYGDPLVQSREGTAGVDSSEAGDPEANSSFTRANGRPQRSAARSYQVKSKNGYSTDDELADDADEDSNPSGEEWQGDDDDVEGKLDRDEDDDDSGNESDDSMMDVRSSLIVTLRYKKTPSNLSKQTAPNGEMETTSGDYVMHESPSKSTVQSPTIVHRPKPVSPPSFPQSTLPQEHESSSATAPHGNLASVTPLVQHNEVSKPQINGVSAYSEDQPMDSAIALPDISSSPSDANQHPPSVHSPSTAQSAPSLEPHPKTFGGQDFQSPANQVRLPSFQQMVQNTESAAVEPSTNGSSQFHGQTQQNGSAIPTTWHPNALPGAEAFPKPLFQHQPAQPQSFGSSQGPSNHY